MSVFSYLINSTPGLGSQDNLILNLEKHFRPDFCVCSDRLKNVKRVFHKGWLRKLPENFRLKSWKHQNAQRGLVGYQSDTEVPGIQM